MTHLRCQYRSVFHIPQLRAVSLCLLNHSFAALVVSHKSLWNHNDETHVQNNVAKRISVCESLSLNPLTTIWKPLLKFQNAPDSSSKNAWRLNMVNTHSDSSAAILKLPAVWDFFKGFRNFGACAYNAECVRVGTRATGLMQQFKVWSLAVLHPRLFVMVVAVLVSATVITLEWVPHTVTLFVQYCLDKWSTWCRQQSNRLIFSLLNTNWEKEQEGKRKWEWSDE